MFTFLHKTNVLHLWTLLFPVLSFKNTPNWYFPIFGFIKKIIYHLWTQRFFKFLTSWNIRFNKNRIFIFLFNFKVYIVFLPFVFVNTFSVRLLLYISRTKLLKKMLDVIQGLLNYIQGVLLFLIHLDQSNYFFSKTFNLIIQSMNIWKIISPDIFQVFRKGKISVVLHVSPNDIMSHNIMI